MCTPQRHITTATVLHLYLLEAVQQFFVRNACSPNAAFLAKDGGNHGRGDAASLNSSFLCGLCGPRTVHSPGVFSARRFTDVRGPRKQDSLYTGPLRMTLVPAPATLVIPTSLKAGETVYQRESFRHKNGVDTASDAFCVSKQFNTN